MPQKSQSLYILDTKYKTDVTKMPQQTVRISAAMVDAIKKFLETDEAKARGYDSVSDVTTAAVRSLLEDYGYYERREATAATVKQTKQDTS